MPTVTLVGSGIWNSGEGDVSNKTTNPSPDGEPSQNRRLRGKFHERTHAHPSLALTTKIVVTLVGTLMLLAGVVMLVTPGPAFVMIPLGLAILATEWEWARRWLEKARDQARRAKEKSEAMDPKVRRRRLLLIGLAVVVVIGAVAAYVAFYEWPVLAVDGWDWVQGMAGWVPELPGM